MPKRNWSQIFQNCSFGACCMVSGRKDCTMNLTYPKFVWFFFIGKLNLYGSVQKSTWIHMSCYRGSRNLYQQENLTPNKDQCGGRIPLSQRCSPPPLLSPQLPHQHRSGFKTKATANCSESQWSQVSHQSWCCFWANCPLIRAICLWVIVLGETIHRR